MALACLETPCITIVVAVWAAVTLCAAGNCQISDPTHSAVLLPGQEVEKLVCAGRPEEDGKSRIFWLLIIMEQLCMVIFGMMIEKFVRHGWTPLAVVAADGRSQPRVDEAIQAMRSVMTQTPVRYTWYASQPRFVPLGEREHGAWLW